VGKTADEGRKDVGKPQDRTANCGNPKETVYDVVGCTVGQMLNAEETTFK